MQLDASMKYLTPGFYKVLFQAVDNLGVQPNSMWHTSGAVIAMSKQSDFPFDLDLSILDTASLTNILSDIEHHLPLMESAGDLDQLLEVKAFFETELKVSRRLH